ncbi:MAG TPA: PQQ-binding-like beta-propeller repeat protein, partial [Acidimicrobiales bacterium]|nr:PQQ-binding-like beta-propeller repeat protein [Acidimicrobiales bacterium]
MGTGADVGDGVRLRSAAPMLGLGLLVAGVVPMTVVGPNLPLVASRSAARQSPPTYVWPKIAHDSANTGLSADPGISNANAGTLGVRWMASTGASSVSSPVVAWNATLQKTLVYQGNDSGYLTAFDASDGATVWSVNLGSTILSSPLVEGNFVWIARAYGAVMYKLDAATGAVTCSTTLGSESDGSPTIGTPAGGSSTIYIAMHDLGTASGPLYGINEANCAVDFQFTGFNSVAGSWDPLSYATDVDGRALVLMGTSDPDQSVYAIDALTGTKVWSFVTPPLAGNTDTDVGAGIDVSPPGVNGFADGVAYVPAEDGYFFALDLTTGAVLWKYDFGTGLPQIHLSRSTPALAGNRLVFGEIGGVMCLDATTGALDWSFATGDVESISDPAIVGPASGQVVAVTTLAGAVDVLDLASGNLLYSFQTPTYSTSSIADVDGNLLASSADGYLYDFALGGGNGAGPSTAVTSPTAGSTIANPTGSELIRGTATAASGEDVEQVDVAIQSGGPSGQWWDGVTGTWTAGFFDNAATVVSPGTPSTDWSYSVPVPLAGGHFSVFASSAQGNGLADVTDLSATPGSSLVSFSIRN